jgi:hypothetical protein
MIDGTVDQVPQLTVNQEKYQQQIEQLKRQEESLADERSKYPSKIKVGDMPEQNRYNQLKTESKKIINIIRMIAYRAETAVANLISPIPENKNAHNFKRMIVKQITNAPADPKPDYDNKILLVRLHHLSAKRYNKAIRQLVELLNQTEIIFPGTDLKLVF